MLQKILLQLELKKILLKIIVEKKGTMKEERAIMNFRKTKSELSLLQIDYELLELQQKYLQKALELK